MKKQKNSFGRRDAGAAEIVKYLLLSLVIVAGASLCVCHASCQLSSQGIQALGAEESPEIQGVSVVNASSLEVTFSKPVSVTSASVSKLELGERASLDATAKNPVKARAVMSSDKKNAVYVFEKKSELGVRYQLFSEVKDSRGNSLTFAIPFDGFNERLPRCVFTEVQPKARSSKDGAESPYVIIRALEEGNLSGMDLRCVKKDKTYSLPKIEVSKGEEIILHLRMTKDEKACQSELGNDLALASSGRSSPVKRDLFFDLGVPLDEKNDLLLLRDRNANKTIEALTYFTPEKDMSVKWNFSEALQKAISDKAWEGNAGAASAVSFEGGGTTKPLVRTDIPSPEERRPSSKYDWTVSKESVYK